MQFCMLRIPTCTVPLKTAYSAPYEGDPTCGCTKNELTARLSSLTFRLMAVWLVFDETLVIVSPPDGRKRTIPAERCAVACTKL